MHSSGERRRRFGMTGRQIAFLAVLAVLSFAVVIGGGYYVLADSGLLGGEENELVAHSPETPTMTSTSKSQPTATLTPDENEGNPLPPTWTPTPTLTEVPPDTSGWTLSSDDLPVEFEETTLDELGLDTEPDLFEGEYPIVDIFSYIDSNDAFESIYGWIFLIQDEPDQADFDTAIQDMDLFTNQLIEDLGVEEVIDQQELEMPEDIGDSSRSITVVARIEDIDFRFDMVLFRRNSAGVYCVTIYLDGENPIVPLQYLALSLDTHIRGIE